MPSPPLILFIADGRLYKSFGARQPLTDTIELFAGDTGKPVQIRSMEEAPGGDQAVPWAYKPIGGTTWLGIGDKDQKPTEGTFTITDTEAAQTTAAIAYNASAAAVQAAVRAGCTTNYSACTVTGAAGGPWVVDRVTTTDIDPLTGNGDGLYPESFVGVGQTRVGSATFSKRQEIRLVQKPAVFVDSWTALPVAAVSVTSTQGGGTGVNEVQKVSINTDCYSGTFTLAAGAPINKASGAIPFDCNASDFATILNAAFGAANAVTVTKTGNDWFVEFTGASVLAQSIPLMTGDPAGLKVPIGLKGVLNLKTTGIQNLVGAEDVISTVLEVKNSDPDSATILQIDINIRNILLDDAATGATLLPSYVTLTQLLDFLMGTPNAITESGSSPVSAGDNIVPISFAVTKSSAAWHFLGMPYLKNTVDGTKWPAAGELTALNADGGTFELVGAPMDGNTVLVWHVVIDP